MHSPDSFYRLANRFLKFRAKPVHAHYFIKQFAAQRTLFLNYTQNIDSLEIDAGIPSKFLIQAHGHMRSAHCAICQTEVNLAIFNRYVRREEVLRCKYCENGVVKPDIVFFGEKLPMLFQEKFQAILEADLVIVMGTSLKVKPFSTLISMLPISTPLVVLNHTNPGIVRERFLFLPGDIESNVAMLMKAIGWELNKSVPRPPCMISDSIATASTSVSAIPAKKKARKQKSVDIETTVNL